jgi:hypothetical protein
LGGLLGVAGGCWRRLLLLLQEVVLLLLLQVAVRLARG